MLASVSSPSYDPESLLGGDAAEVWESLLADPDGPLLDRATRDLPAGLDVQDRRHRGRARHRNGSPRDRVPRPRGV